MQKIPCHCQTDAQQRVASALRRQISPLDLLSFMKLFLFFSPYTPRSVTSLYADVLGSIKSCSYSVEGHYFPFYVTLISISQRCM